EELKTLINSVNEMLFSQELRFTEFISEPQLMVLSEVLIKNSVKNKAQKYQTVQSISNKYGFINQEEIFEDRRVASLDISNYYIVKKGYFAYNPSRINVGSLAYKKDDEISVISPLYISFKVNNNILDDHFIWYWFKSTKFIRQMYSSFEGSVRNTLSYESLIKMNISIPSLEEQKRIFTLLLCIDNKIETEKKLLKKYQSQKQYLLQNLFI
ncbi:restriction endonuclease subunit S, partial [Chryseobacterium sp. 2987]|uniref:restriction endonuclease subunit S n=1 Tax=Chryseobacterium sp. 2987 TaxID=2817767 RepID=UPI002855BEA1